MLKKYAINPTLNMVTGQWSNDGEVWIDDSNEIKFDRAAQANAKKSLSQARDVSSQEQGASNQIASTLIPGLEGEATNPTGYSPEEEASMLTAAEQGAGGATSGIVGQADLQAGRTRNSAGYTSALDDAMREKGRLLSEDALGIKNRSADLAQEKQRFAQGELGNVMSEKDKSMLSAMGLQTEDINAETESGKSGWLQNMNQTIEALSGAANSAAGVKKAFG